MKALSLTAMSTKQKLGRIIFCTIILLVLAVIAISLVNAIKWINKPFAGFLLTQRMVVGYNKQYHWTGIQAGLRYPDKILRANNHTIYSMKDLDDVVTKVAVGEPVTYLIERDGGRIEVAVSTMLFTGTDFFMTYGINFLVGVFYLTIGIIVFILKPDTMATWSFFLACFLQGISAMLAFDLETTHFGFNRVQSFIAAFLPATVVHLSLFFPRKLPLVEKRPRIIMIPYIISMLLLITFTLLYPRPLFLYVYRAIIVYTNISIVIFIVSIFFAYFNKSSILARQRAKVVLSGALLGLPLPAVNLLTLSLGIPLGAGKVLSDFADIPLLVFPASIAYGIAKHDLFDVDVYIKRTVGYVMMTSIVGMTYFGLQTLISAVILQPILGAKAESVYPVLFAILVVFCFNPLNHVVQGWVDRLFYRKKFDYKATVTAVSQTLSSLLNLDEVIRQVINTVRKEMFIDTTGVVLLEPKNKSCKTFFIGDSDNPVNKVKDQIKDVRINYDDPLLALLSKEKKLITRYDIEEDPKYLDVRKSCVQRFTEMGATLAMPMVHKDEMKGALVLGNKKSGHFYTREDIDLLTTLTSQGAVAIVNARLFEENLEKQRMEDELRIAHDIQVSMLPEKAPEIEGFEIAGMSIPAKEVGGDFYDYIEISSGEGSNRLAIVIGDVTGKGVSGALMMAASRSTYRVLAEQYSSVEELMGVGNRRLNKDIKKGMFVALLYAELNPQEKTLTLSNAGQTQPILCPADRSTQPHYIDTEGDRFPLGIIKDCTYQETEVRLKSGDVVVFYTDGVVEAMNDKGEMYGFERLMTSIGEGRGLGADAVMDKLMSDISGYVGSMEQHDDLTVVVVKME